MYVRRSLLPFALLLPLALSAGSGGPFRDLPLDGALAAAKKEKKLVLLDFYASWCGPCKLMDRTTWKDPEVLGWIDKNAVAIKVEGDKKRDLSGKYRVTGFPTVLLLRPDGTEAGRAVGYRSPEDLLLFARASAEGKDVVAYLEGLTLPGGKPDPRARLRSALELAQTGRFEAAVKASIWCVEHGAESDPAFVADLPQAVSILAQLSQVRPEAREYLNGMRASLEAEIEGGGGDLRTAELLGSANQVLGEPSRTLKAYDAVAGQGDARRTVREVLYRYCFYQLHAAGRWEEIVRDAGDPAGLGAKMVGVYRSAVGPTEPVPGAPEYRQAALLKDRVVQEASMLYEALLGAGKTAEADSLARTVLDFAPTGRYYALFVTAAVRSGEEARGVALRDRGYQLLPSEQVLELQRAAGTLGTAVPGA